MANHFLTCGTCKRQLDVSALGIGDQVVCACGAELAVGQPQDVDPSELPCGHCGGAVRPYRPDESGSGHCESCDRPIRMAALPPIPNRRTCPSCDDDLRIHLVEGAALTECEGCGGIWARRDAFARLVQNASPPSGSGPEPSTKTAPSPQAPAEGDLIPCVACGQKMRRVHYHQAGLASDVLLDVCTQHGIWFDHDELRRVLGFARQVGGDFDPKTAYVGAGPSVPVVHRKGAVQRSLEEERGESVLEGIFESGDYFVSEFIASAIAALFE